MSVIYKIRVYDHAGVMQIESNVWENLSFSRKLNQVGTFDMVLRDSSTLIQYLIDDALFEIYRKDGTENWLLVWEGFVKDEARNFKAGEGLYQASGVTYNHLIQRRVIVGAKDSARALKSGPAETVILEYLKENIGSDATVAAGRWMDGQITGITLPVSLGRGLAWKGDKATQNLYQTVNQIIETTSLYYDLNLTSYVGWTLKINEDWLNDDRSSVTLNPNTGKNAEGNAPVQFSLGNGTMSNPNYSVKRKNAKNYALIIGTGVENEVVYSSLALPAGISPWDQSEIVVQERQSEDGDVLDSAGYETLAKNSVEESFEFEIIQSQGLRYGRDYHFGDRVDAVYKTISKTCIIDSMNGKVSQAGENLVLRAVAV